NLAGEISQEFAKRQYDDLPIDALMELVQQIVAFHMKHNAEPEAVDLLMEVEDLDLLVEHVDSTNYKRTCLYLTSSSSYLPSPDDILALDIAYTIYMKFEDLASSLRIALLLDNIQYVKQIFTSTNDPLLKKQFSYICAHHGIALELDEEWVPDEEERELFSLGSYLILPLFFLMQPITTWFFFVNYSLQALALLGDFIEKDDTIIRIGAILGLGIAYAGTNKDELRVRLTAILGDSKSPLEVLVFSAITLGLVHVGSCNEYIAQTIILAIMERSESELSEPLTRLLPVALGLLYLGKQ
ncbi:26S proteasome non-ATPase regulatory subunit 2 homolog A-like, partial [Dendrobium catenatum]|uniref:26S proteasome non-ATPase regulatory subunit 2 homolog A-like n=1 Tax=Dendrobium catenatum TaxID=906689 RepID=UPI00109F0664